MALIDERAKRVITEQEIRNASPGDTIRIGESAIVTPLAADLARERGVRLERVPRRTAFRRFKIALGADHGGFEAKEALKTEDLDRMKRAQDTLSKAAQKLGEIMYREAQQSQAGPASGQETGSQQGGAAGRSSGTKEGEVVDAEFEDLGEKK